MAWGQHLPNLMSQNGVTKPQPVDLSFASDCNDPRYDSLRPRVNPLYMKHKVILIDTSVKQNMVGFQI